MPQFWEQKNNEYECTNFKLIVRWKDCFIYKSTVNLDKELVESQYFYGN